MNALNDDVVLLILHGLESADLAAVCLTCRSLRTIAAPVLYRELNWKWSSTINPPVVPFLNTILHRPALAEHVRSLSIACKEGRSQYGYPLLPPVPVEALDETKLAETLAKLNVPFMASWKHELLHKSMDALLALLVSQMTTLAQLHLDHVWAMESVLLGKVIAAGIDGTPNLPTYCTMSSVDIGCWHSQIRRKWAGNNRRALLSFFYLPNIRKLTILLDNPVKLVWPLQPLVCASLVSLNLSGLREYHLEDILRVTPNLEQLHYTWRYEPGWVHCPTTFHSNELMAGLHHVKLTLQSLTITLLNHDDYHMRVIVDAVGSIVPLTTFSALRALQVPISWIDDFGHYEEDYNFSRTIPPGIQRLSLRDDLHLHEEWAVDVSKLINGLEDMLSSREHQFPMLSSITIELEGKDGWSKEDIDRVEELGRLHGVSLLVC